MEGQDFENPEDRRELRFVPADRVRRSPFQVRRETAPDPELTASIATHGLINPVTVREDGAGGYELIAGHRRFAAFRAVRPNEAVPAVVIEADDAAAEDLLVSENLFRKDLSLMEEAMSVAMLRAHGRTVEQVATVVRKSERWVYRRMALGGIDGPWREFLHAWNATYDEAARIARLPAAVREAAWARMLDDLADACDFGVRKGNADDARHREAFLAALAAAAGDREEFLATMAKGAPDDRLRTAEDAEARVRQWLDAGLGKFLRTQRLVDRRLCPFDCASCAGCARRSDVAPSMLDADDPVRTVPQCLDAACWARKAAAAAPSPSPAPTEAPGRHSGDGSDQTASPLAAEPSSAQTGDAASGNAAPASTPPRGASDAGPRAGAKDSSSARGGAEPLSEGDLGVRMGVVWTVSQLLHGDRLEDVLPRIADLRAEAVRRGGWLAHVRENALPRLSRNQEAARAALGTVRGMW